MRLQKDEIARRAEKIVSSVKSAQPESAIKLELVDGESVVGGGAAPSAVLPTRLIAMSAAFSADELSVRLRANNPPIIARVEEGRVLLDLRTVFPEQDANLVNALASLA